MNDWTHATIRRLRDDAGLTRTQFAARLGVCEATVSRWETGMRSPRGLAIQALDRLDREIHPPPPVSWSGVASDPRSPTRF